jgi:hypothetical protein
MASAPQATVDTLLRCLQVRDVASYQTLCDAFEVENAQRDVDRVEMETVGPFPARVHIHDPRSMLVVRLIDEGDEPLHGARLLLKAGTPPNPDWMPQGFMLDRQANSHHGNVITFFLNHALLAGTPRVADPDNSRRTLRAAVDSHRPYSATIEPSDLAGLVHHAIASTAPGDDLLRILAPHQTTVLDVVLPRHVREGLFRLTQKREPEDFSQPVLGDVIP